MRAHGTRAKYVAEKCRCAPCTSANREYARGNERRRVQASWGAADPAYVPADTAREHLAGLRESGLGTRRISSLTGVARSVIQRIGSGDLTRIRPETEAALLSITPDAPLAGAVPVDAELTLRRIQRLLDAGWTHEDIGQRIGRTGNAVRQVGKKGRVTADTHRAVAALARQVTA